MTAPVERHGRRILVAAEATAEGITGLRLAARLALEPDDELIAVTVTSPALPVSMGVSTISGAPGPWLMGWLEVAPDDEAVAAGAVELLDRVPCAVRSVVRDGPASRAMCESVEWADPDLVVVPDAAPRGRLGRFLFGDPWSTLVDQVAAPILLARPDPEGHDAARPGDGSARGLSVLVAIDDPRAGADAIRHLLRLPIPSDARILVLALVPGSDAQSAVAMRQRMGRRLDVAVRMLRDKGLSASRLVLVGGGSGPVLETAAAIDADLVVVGAGHVPVRGRLAGLARSVAQDIPVGVLVVPAGLPRRAPWWRRGHRPRASVGRRSVDGSIRA